MNSLNLLAIMPKEIKKWAKPFTDAILGTLKQIAGVPFQKELAIVYTDISDVELEKIKDQIIRTDLFIFILSPEYVSFEQMKGLLQLVKAREMILKAKHKIVFSVLRESCKMPPYFLQTPLYDFIGESFNTPSFKSKYVKLIKDIATAMKTSDQINKGKTAVLEAEAIPISAEPNSFQASEAPVTETPPTPLAPEFVSQPEAPSNQHGEEEPIILEPESPAPAIPEIPSQPEARPSDIDAANESQDLEDIDFLEPFNNDAIPSADAIPAAPELGDELTPKPIEHVIKEKEPIQKATPEFVEIKDEETLFGKSSAHKTEIPDEPETYEQAFEDQTQDIEDDLSDDFNSDFDNDLEDEPVEKNVVDISKELEDSGFAGFDDDEEESADITDSPTEEPDFDELLEDNTNENLDEKMNSEIDMSDEDDILSKNNDEPKREEEAVEHKPVNELNADDNWDSFIDDESKSDKKPEPAMQNNKPVEDEDEELQPWTGSARTYADPDIKKKTESFEKKKSKTQSLQNGMKPKTRKLRPKRRRPKLETDADIISGEISDDGYDVLDELGIDIDNIPDEPVHKEEKKKTDTSIFEQLSDQEDLSLDDDLSFDNELVLDDLEDKSVEDDEVGAEFGMSKITLTDDSDQKKSETKKIENDIVDELDLDLDIVDKPKGNCTVFMNKVPESRIEDAIQMVHEINGMEKSEIETLLGRIVIPVLKDVFADEAEKALDKIKRAGFNGRIRKT